MTGFNTLNPNAGGIDIFNSNGDQTLANGPSSASGQQDIYGSSLPTEIMLTTYYQQTNAQTNADRINAVTKNEGIFSTAIDGVFETIKNGNEAVTSVVSSAWTGLKNTTSTVGDAVGGFLSGTIWKLVLILVLVFIGFVVITRLTSDTTAKLA